MGRCDGLREGWWLSMDWNRLEVEVELGNCQHDQILRALEGRETSERTGLTAPL